MPRPILAKVDTSALESNLNSIRNFSNKSNIWSVVKANGYGHSLNAVLKGLRKTDGFALLDLNEAVFLRENGWNGPILLLEGFFQKKDIELIDNYNLTTVIHNVWQIDVLSKSNIRNPINVYVKLNSGMNRLGFNNKNFIEIWDSLIKLRQVSTLTLMTHFSSYMEIKNSMKIVRRIIYNKSMLETKSCLASSLAILKDLETHKQWIRPGIILYGSSPTGNREDISSIRLQPVMTLESELISIQEVSEGEYIGYDSRKINSKCRIGIVACGYADGYPRHASIGTPILVDGIKTKIISLVSMDTIAVDLTPCPFARIGSKVELWGKHISIDEIATLSGTLPYEIMSKLSSRVKIETF